MRGNHRLLPLLLIPVLAGAVVPAAAAETDSSVAVERSAMARKVVDREPVDVGTKFPADIGQLSCFTRLVGTQGQEFIYHVWLHGGEERARVELAVRGPAWRTWSTKRIQPSWTGHWAVEIQDADGNVLKSLPFTVEETMESTESSR